MASKRLTNSQIYTLLSVLCAIFLAALDQTIVATAAPKIARDLHDFEAISWIFSAYMMASTVLIPIYGKLSDIYGRRFFYLGGIAIFLVGSMLSGAAMTMWWLIAARVLQGLGAGAIMVESFTIIGDLFPPAERGKWQGLISSIFGLASIIGPLLGGILADYASWRWVFYINLPIGIVAMILIHFHFPAVLKEGTDKKINYASALLLALCLLSFLFALVRSENHGRWISTDIIALYILSALSLGVFILCERRAINPIFPAVLFHNRVFVLSIISVGLLSFCMFGVVSYIPLFAQMALGASPSRSGLILIPFVLSMTLAAASAGQIISRTGKYKMLLVIGVLSTTVGLYALSHISVDTSSHEMAVSLALVGLGIGITMPIYLVIVQSSFGHDRLGLVTSSMQLIRNIGSTLGTALLGTLIITYVEKHLLKLSAAFGDKDLSLSNLADILTSAETNARDQSAISALRGSFAEATHIIIICCLGLALITLALAFFMPTIRLRKTNVD